MILSGCQNVDSGIGIYAGSHDSYTTFAEVFDDIVLDFLNEINLILIMSVHPGFGGQKFMSESLEKVKILRKEIYVKQPWYFSKIAFLIYFLLFIIINVLYSYFFKKQNKKK